VIEVPVELGARRYAVSIGHGATGLLSDLLARFRGRRVVLVSNARVFSLHGRRVEAQLARIGPLARVLVPDGERHKSWRSLERLCDAFLAARLGRDGLVVALGGGVVGDLTGFAASVYMRGVDWVGVPTTLLAMVDSSVGGKVGVNHPRAKNLIGAFHQPRAVIVDPELLSSLAPRERRSGVYEILKCGVLGDRALFKTLTRLHPALEGWARPDVDAAIASACRIKAKIVGRDEREGGLRRVLNLGHTLGHALEAVTAYRRFTHGEAVGWGLIGAAWIACRRGLLRERDFDAIAAAVDHVGPRPRVSDLPARALLEAVSRDKKALGGRVHFVLPTAIGRVSVRNDVSVAELRGALRALARC
jgi:3-dehydroquinate synthase